MRRRDTAVCLCLFSLRQSRAFYAAAPPRISGRVWRAAPPDASEAPVSSSRAAGPKKHRDWSAVRKAPAYETGGLSTRLPPEGDELQCPHFAECSGCSTDRQFMNTPVTVEAASFCETQLSLTARTRRRSQRAAAEQEPPKFEVHMGAVHGWRTHAKLAATPKGKYGGVQIGLYKAGSHSVLPIPQCRVHHPAINEAIGILTAAVSAASDCVLTVLLHPKHSS